MLNRTRLSKASLFSMVLYGLLCLVTLPLAAQEPSDAYAAALLAYRKGDLVDAQLLFRTLNSQNTVCDECNLYQGKVAAERGHLAEAESYLATFTAEHPASPDGWYALGYLRFLQKRARESLAVLEHAAQLRAPTSDELRLGGTDYVLLNDMLPAIALFKRSLALEPSNTLSQYYLGRALYTETLYTDAIGAYAVLLKLSPHDVRAEDGLGLCYQSLLRKTEAEANFRQAVAWNSEAAKPFLFPVVDLADFLVEQNRSSEAVVLLRNALARYLSVPDTDRPNFVRAERLLGKIELHLGQSDEAAHHLSVATQGAPEDSSTHFLLGQAYRKNGNGDLAAREFRLSQDLLDASYNRH